MKLLAESSGSGRRAVGLVGATAFIVFALLSIAAQAHASETIYWDNYGTEELGNEPATIGFANTDGSGGGKLNLAGTEIHGPEGMAYDSANGRIYVASSSNDEIVWVATDGSGAGVLDTTGAPVENPQGIAVDPQTQMVYWVNTQKNGSLGYASANGGGGGTLNTLGAATEYPYKLALDTVDSRVYWASQGGEFSYANLDGSGGANLNVPEAQRPPQWGSIDIDVTAGRLYFFEDYGAENHLRWINTSGVGGGEVDLAGAPVAEPYGMAFDPSEGRFYWANFGNAEVRNEAIGTVGLTGGGGGITPATAPVHGPQDPLILKSPIGTGAPQISGSGTTLSCSQGSWKQDYPGSYVYAAPLAYAYQWSVDGQAIPGATGSTLTATTAGSYACTVTAGNAAGSAAQTSAGLTVIAVERATPTPTPTPTTTPAKLALKPAVKKAVTVKAGKVAIVKVDVTNAGGTAPGAVKVCGKLTMKAKKGLLAPRCVSIASVPPGGTTTATLRVKARKTARGPYTITVVINGPAPASATVHLKVTASNRHKEKPS